MPADYFDEYAKLPISVLIEKAYAYDVVMSKNNECAKKRYYKKKAKELNISVEEFVNNVKCDDKRGRPHKTPVIIV